MKADRKSMCLYAVTDRSWLGEKSVAMQVEEALLGGATFIQLREKELCHEEFLAEARKIKEICARFNVPFVINDNVEIAHECDADGIHIGQGDMPVDKVREILGKDKIIGVSAQTVEQALLAQEQGADYLGVGAVFSTSTKLDADSVSFEMLKNICSAVNIPVVAIGGISKDNIMKLSGSGVDGVAVVSALFAKSDITLAAKELRQLSENMIQAGIVTEKADQKDQKDDFDQAIDDLEGVIFDLDGVILDSMPVWDVIGKRYLIKCEIEPVKDICEILRPMSLMQAAQYFKSEYGIQKSPEEIIQGINAELEDFYLYEAGLKPGVEAFINRLSKKNVKMCITTATERALVDAALIRNNIDEYFEKIFTCNELGHGKDEAFIYEEALNYLGTEKERTLVIEDAYHAVITAKNAGFRVAAVYDDSVADKREELEKKSDYYIDSFEKWNEIKKVLTIAGSDCSGGAGIQADIKTITVHKMYAMSVITALTAQNTTGVYGIQEATPEFVGKQMDAIFTDIRPDAIKIGMVSSEKIIDVIVEKLIQYKAENIVVDPVMVSTSGSRLLSDDAMNALVSKLIPLARVITPNIPEAEVLCGHSIKNEDDMVRAAKEISGKLKGAVLVKGGHLVNDAIDLLYENGNTHWFKSERVETENTHGTGCTLSSAIACNLAAGKNLDESIRSAKAYLTGALKDGLDIGYGSGPLNHTYAIKY